jgi:hypothetical protein
MANNIYVFVLLHIREKKKEEKIYAFVAIITLTRFPSSAKDRESSLTSSIRVPMR